MQITCRAQFPPAALFALEIHAERCGQACKGQRHQEASLLYCSAHAHHLRPNDARAAPTPAPLEINTLPRMHL